MLIFIIIDDKYIFGYRVGEKLRILGGNLNFFEYLNYIILFECFENCVFLSLKSNLFYIN